VFEGFLASLLPVFDPSPLLTLLPATSTTHPQEICIPLLYRDVKLSSSRAILNFARTIFATDPPSSIDFAPLTVRMDVDLSPYLNEHDKNGDPVLDPEIEGLLLEREFEAGSEVATVARLLKALVGLKMFLWVSENVNCLLRGVLDCLNSSVASEVWRKSRES